MECGYFFKARPHDAPDFFERKVHTHLCTLSSDWDARLQALILLREAAEEKPAVLEPHLPEAFADVIRQVIQNSSE
tara:strand:+ start:1069 stop:1296 length:228 start_codon:yes stop_codon:yes gene_type:complete